MPKLGPYSRDIVLARPDGRTKEARLLKQVRQELTRHLGGKLTAPQRALVERAAYLQLRRAVLDQHMIDGTFSDFDSKQYLAFANSLRRALSSLGLDASAAEKPPSLDDIRRELAERAA